MSLDAIPLITCRTARRRRTRSGALETSCHPAHELAPSHTNDRYAEWAFGDVLGEGTFGVVRAATHRVSGDECAVKILSRSGLERQ